MNAKKPNKKTSVKKSKSAPTQVLFQLDGQVFIVEKKGKKVVSKTELDGKVVLKCVMHCLKYGLDLLEHTIKKEHN